MLERLGCSVDIYHDSLTIRGGNMLGCHLDLNATPDALPAMAVTGCFARGKTYLENVPQARLKETDRISVMAEELGKLGGVAEELEDGLILAGGPLKGAPVDAHSDHRVAMAMAIAGLGASGETTINGAESAEITYPGFFDQLRSLVI
jgi:3-phosphoshikimate 1-carboxyvinyltransferase